MSDLDIRFVHVISDELLGVVMRERESFGSWNTRNRTFLHRKFLHNLLEVEDLPENLVEKYKIDTNWFRKYTFSFAFPNADEGDFDTVTWAFARQGDGDQFSRAQGRKISMSRLLAYLDSENGYQGKRGYSVKTGAVPFVAVKHFMNEDSFTIIQKDNPVSLPEKVVKSMEVCQRQLKKRAAGLTIAGANAPSGNAPGAAAVKLDLSAA